MDENKKLKIAFLCHGLPWDKANWSGTIYKIYESLISHGYEVEHIPVTEYSPREKALFEKIAAAHENIFNRTFNRHQFLLKSKIASARLQKILAKKDYDILIAVSQINELAFLKTTKPIIFINDALFELMIGYYPYYKGLGWYSKKIFTSLEKRALKKCSAVIFPSEWSVQRAVNLYHLDPEKIHLLRFGPNIEVPNAEISRNYSGDIELLFLGVEWERKGGAIALGATEILRKKGFPVKLVVVGCVPPVESGAMEVIPFLNKNKPEDYQKLKSLLSESHLLFVPTRAECYGIVFCEASAYGLPSITTATGGVTSIVKDGVNGFALPETAGAAEYAEKIEEILIENPLENLSSSSRKRYEEALTWELWGEEMYEIIRNLSLSKK